MVTLDGSSLTTVDVARVLFDFEEASFRGKYRAREKSRAAVERIVHEERQYTASPPDLANSVMS